MYIPLFNTSNYTLLSSLLKIDDLIEYAINNKLPSIALTDSNMYGTMEFIKKCNKNNIKPIIGLNIKQEDFNYIVLAKSLIGYKNLLKLSTIQNERLITQEEISTYNKELIVLVPFNYKEKFNDLSNDYEDIYLGYSSKEEELESLLITKNIVFLRENLYLNKEDKKILPYLYKIRDSKTIKDEDNYDIDNHELNIKNIEEISSIEGIENTLNISNMINVVFEEPELLLPEYDVEKPTLYLRELCKKGLEKRLNKKVTKEYVERLNYELDVIEEMGFSNYFLVVYDFIKYAKKNKILVGPGRGSAAGSLVAYTLGITEIDPLKYDLLFERFLNKDRKTMPDIDTDFPDNRRDEVIEYVINKYGKKRVCGIITFGTLGAKQAIRDVSRVMNIPLYKVDSLCKFIKDPKEKLISIYENNETFKVRVDQDNLLKEMIDIAIKLEGYPRHTSQHAAGIIMSKVDLDEVIPLTVGDNMYLSSYSMEYLEDLGLLKMDFLALKNLTIIDNIINEIKEQENIDLEFNKIPLDDKETLKLFETGNTAGIFQFESTGMKNFLKRLKPNSFEDIFAAIALFRPGPSQNIDTYIRRKHGLEKIEFLDPSLEEITKNTYGILIYQEQIMQLARAYAGYSLGEADILRRAMSKKKKELIEKEKDTFIKKSIEHNHNKEQAEKIFDLVLEFAGYGFNRSHSVVYSIIAYKMAYLKCHYKAYFYANILSNVIGSESKTYEYIMEAKSNKLEIDKPTIEESSEKYIVKDNRLIFPLSSIKSIGTIVTKEINEAKKDGDFINIFNCFSRLYIAGLGKKNFETLIYANVFKNFKYNRKTLIENLDSLINYAELTKDLGYESVMTPVIEEKEEYPNSYLLEKEKEAFGFYLSGHPTTAYREDNQLCIRLNEVENNFNKQVDTIILVDKIKVINTKSGDKMAFISGSDETSTLEYTLFPKTYKQYSNIEKGYIIKVRGNVERRLNEYQIIVEKIKVLEGEKNEQE